MSKKYTDLSSRRPDHRASHGMTMAQMDDHYYNQQHGLVEMVPCSEDPEVQIKKIEAEYFYYLEMEAVLFDSSTGEKLSVPKRVKYHERMYDHELKKNRFNGYKIRILNNPVKVRERNEIGAQKLRKQTSEK